MEPMRSNAKRLGRRMAVMIAAMTAASCGGAPSSDEARMASLVISNVTVIDPASRSVLQGKDVYLDDDRIAAIVDAGAEAPYTAEKTLSGENRYLTPGFIDMHVHMGEHPMLAPASAPLFIANGVTGVRDMSSDCWEPRGADDVCIDDMRARAAGVESGDIVGPRLYQLSSMFVRGEAFKESLADGAEAFIHPANAAEARRLARYLKARGVDFIKTYSSLSPEAYAALTLEARKLDLPVAGHVPLRVSSSDAAIAGQRSVEHARALLYDCSDYGPAYRASALSAPPDDETRLGETIRQFNQVRCAQMLKTLAENDVYYVPTHETREMEARVNDPDYINDPRLQYTPPLLWNMVWSPDLEATRAASPEVADLFVRFYEHGLKITKMAFDAGVPILVGTDANDTMCFPGFSFHDEMGHLAKAGLAPMDILRSATTTAAEYLGREDEIGGVSAGMKADLVLLGADPLTDIANTTAIEAVIFNGAVYDRSALEAMKAGVAAQLAP